MSTFQIGSRPAPGFDDPAGVLLHCHRRIEQRLAALPKIISALRSSPEGGDEDALGALSDVLRYFDNGARRHHEDEEASIFPRLAGDESRELLATLADEHRTHEAIYLAFRTVAQRILDTPAEGAPLADELAMHTRALTEVYQSHIAREEKDLVPLIRKLDEVELRAIGIEMRLRRGGSEQ
jgi:hemerythrin-like domain-containing protein